MITHAVNKALRMVLDRWIGFIDRLSDAIYFTNAKSKAYFNFFHISMPMVGIRLHKSTAAGEGKASEKRFEKLYEHLPQHSRTVIDIGSNNGFFSINLA